jgi:BirA family biotin operon repressor/biotin-[acetyl-CoA-carboxylase] ligase
MDLSETEQALWRALGGAESLSVNAHASTFADTLAIVDVAPRSQMAAVQDLLLPGLRLQRPLVCVARDGAGFCGQRGRAWTTAPGNLYLTVVLPVFAPVATMVPAIQALPAVAVVDAIRSLGGDAAVKWVNDVEIAERKVGGVLVHSRSVGDTLEHAVLGIGLNVASAPVLSPTPFVLGTTSLAAHGIVASLATILERVLDHLARRWQSLASDGAEPLVAAYAAASAIVGQEVVVFDEAWAPEPGTPPFAAGRVVRIRPDLSLELADTDAPIRHGRLARRTAWESFSMLRPHA